MGRSFLLWEDQLHKREPHASEESSTTGLRQIGKSDIYRWSLPQPYILQLEREFYSYARWLGVGMWCLESKPRDGMQLTLASLVVQRLKHLPATWETGVLSLGREDPLEKEMAAHSSILAWRILWTEEPGGLQSTGREESDTTERLHFHYKETG